jgi:predicted DNA-binding transcriptional regulator YafY
MGVTMAFAKADQLLDLAVLVRAHRAGVTLAMVGERFGVSRRTAQRMMRSLEARFSDLEATYDDEGQKRWRMAGGQLKDFLSLSADELAVLDLAIARLNHDGQAVEARMLDGLREKILALVPSSKASRIETDHDALLEAQGFVARPGPRPRIDPETAAAISEAIKGCLVLEVLYQSQRDPVPKRRWLMPYGLLTGLRRYLVARPENDPDGPVRTYRIDALTVTVLTDRSFVRPPDFDLQAFADRAFGVFQSDAEYGEVVWRFDPSAAAQARGYLFHPTQTTEDEPDGSLLVRFVAAGHLEMAWHLYAWGDKVEVVTPPRLRRMVQGFQRSDFPALP